MSKKTNEIRKRIQIAEEKRGRALTKKERQKIEKNVISKYRRENFIRGAFLALGLTIGAGGHALLSSGNNKVEEDNEKIVVDAKKSDKDIEINNMNNDRELFVNGIKVNLEETETQYEKIIRKEAEKEIESLEKDDILNYIKNFYVTEYNKSKGSNYDEYITTENINFYKYIDLKGLNSGYAQNGDSIFIIDSESKQSIVASSIVSTTIDKDGDKQEEIAASLSGKTYSRVYNTDEVVEQNEDNLLLEELGAIVDTGIDYYNAIGREGDSWGNSRYTEVGYYTTMEQEGKSYDNEECRDRFINAITEYKVNKMEQLIETDEKTTDYEIE